MNEQFLIRITERREACVETHTPWTGKQYDAESDDFLEAYTNAVESLASVVRDQIDVYCKIHGLFGPDREPVEHIVQLLCYDGDKYEIWKSVKVN